MRSRRESRIPRSRPPCRPAALRSGALLAAGLAGIAAALWAAAGSAATVRTELSGKLGTEIMRLEGRIERGDLGKVQMALRELQARQPATDRLIALHSPGGSVEEAVQIARFLKQNGVGTVLLPGTVCGSACAFVFFGGTDLQSGQPWRLAFSGSQLAVHSTRLVERPGRGRATIADANVMLEAVQRKVANLLAFLTELRITPQLQSKILGTPNSDLYVLSEQDKAANGIAVVRLSAGRWRADGSAVRLPKGLGPATAEAPLPAPPSPAPATAAVSRQAPVLPPLSHTTSATEDHVEALPAAAFPVQVVFPGADPADAPGVVLWNPNSGSPDAPPTAVAPYLRLFHRGGWSVLRLDRAMPGDPQEPAVAAIVQEAERLRKTGYRRVVLAGHSRGAWLAIAAAARSEAVHGVIASAPGAYGANSSLAVDRSAAELTALLRASRAGRVALFLFEGDDREAVPGGRGEPSRRALVAAGRPAIVVDRPPGLRGHEAVMSGKFARLYGECLIRFMSETSPTTTRGCDLGTGVAAGSDVRMPPSSLEIVPAPPGTPAAELALLGRWYGIWDDGAARILAVTQLSEGNAEVVYGSADPPTSPDPKSHWWRARWRRDGAALVHEAKEGVRRAAPQPDGQVLLTWTPASGRPGAIVMRRLDPGPAPAPDPGP